MKTANTFPELALLVTSRREQGFFHVYAHPVLVGTEGRPDSVRNVNDMTTVKGGWFLDNLRVYSQANEERRSDGEAHRLYAWEVQFSDTRITLREARHMLRTLTRLDGALDRLAAKRGHARDYGEYVARVAEALGTKRMVFAQNERSHGWSYDDQSYVFVTLGEGRERINAIEHRWADGLRPQAATA